MNKPRDRFLKDIQSEQSKAGSLTAHLAWLGANFGKEGAEIADSLRADLIQTFTTDAGLRVLKLFEKSILQKSTPDGSDDRALREHNAVRNFVLEIRRIVANG